MLPPQTSKDILVMVGRVVSYFAVMVLCLSAEVGLAQSPSTATLAPVSDALASARNSLTNGDIAASEKTVRGYLTDHPKSADGHFLLGFILFREKRATDSLAEFTAGAAIRRPRAEELKTVASDYVLLGDFTDADTWFSHVTTETPNDADAWYLLGRTQYNEGRYDEAVSSFEHALSLKPKNIEAENNLGLAWRESNNQEKAKAAFQTAIDWEGSDGRDAQPFLNLGALLADEGNLAGAIPYLTKAVALAPENPKTHQELGSAYEAQKDLPKAQEELEKAVGLAPKISGLHFKLGEIFRREGLRAQAQEQFAICEKLNSTHSSTDTPNPFDPAAPKKP